MNRIFIFTLAMGVCCQAMIAQEIEYARAENTPESCTSIMVGKKASTDGSVMTSHTCDANYRTYVTIEPRKSFTVSDTEPVYAGLLHNEEPWDMRNVVEKGRIPVHDTITYR